MTQMLTSDKITDAERTRRGETWLASADLRPTRQRVALAAQLVPKACSRLCVRLKKKSPWLRFTTRCAHFAMRG
mgnify:CR=1 FL=1